MIFVIRAPLNDALNVCPNGAFLIFVDHSLKDFGHIVVIGVAITDEENVDERFLFGFDT